MNGQDGFGERRRWEYLRTQVDANKIKESDDALVEFGLQGWELVSVVFTNTWVHFWMKRPLNQI